MTLEQQERLIKELLERGKEHRVTAVQLEPYGDAVLVTLAVRNIDRASWISHKELALLVESAGRGLGDSALLIDSTGRGKMAVAHLGSWYCDRELAAFTPGARAELYTDWQAIPGWREDATCQDGDAAQHLIQLGPDVVRGWCPGVIDRVEGNTVYVNLARLPWFDGQPATQQTIPVGYQSPRLRLA